MEKLIKLLDAYDHKRTEDLEWWKQRVENQKLWIISKQFWFIEWLVNNDKIDFYEWKYLENPIWSNNYDECDYLELIQWLAISDTPIKDLIYYLK